MTETAAAIRSIINDTDPRLRQKDGLERCWQSIIDYVLARVGEGHPDYKNVNTPAKIKAIREGYWSHSPSQEKDYGPSGEETLAYTLSIVFSPNDALWMSDDLDPMDKVIAGFFESLTSPDGYLFFPPDIEGILSHSLSINHPYSFANLGNQH